MPSLAEYPKYEATQHPLKYSQQVSQTNRVNKMLSVLGPRWKQMDNVSVILLTLYLYIQCLCNIAYLTSMCIRAL